MATVSPLSYRTIVLAACGAALLAACASDPARPDRSAGQSSAGMSGKPDAQMQQVLDELGALGAQPLHTLSVKAARQGPTPADAVQRVLQKQGKSTAPTEMARVANGAIPSAAGPIPARLYWPPGAHSASAPLPVVLYIHGGGWVIADLDTYDATPRALAKAANAIVLSTHYRQAPEHTFPAAHDDTWAAYRWALQNAANFGGDPKRIAVAGESAGGNMAAAIALRARDEKVQPPVHQLLVYPVADAVVNSPSERENANAKPLGTPALPWFYDKYLGRKPDVPDGSSPSFALAQADVRGVAPATVILAEIDPLRSEGEAYAKRLESAGVPVRSRTYDGVTHEFFGMGAVVDKAQQAVEFAASGLREAWK